MVEPGFEFVTPQWEAENKQEVLDFYDEAERIIGKRDALDMAMDLCRIKALPQTEEVSY